MKKRDDWFVNYQEIPGKVSGSRLLRDRINLYQQEDFQGRTVLDLGCNIGQMSFQASEWGASFVCGVEYDKAAYKKAVGLNNSDRIEFLLDDLDNPLCWHKIRPHDICLFLSLIDTKELEHRYAILSKAAAKTKKIMYFEGHGADVNPMNKYMKDLLWYTDFTRICYLGQADGRPFIRASREVLSPDTFIQNILASKQRRIGVIGKSLAGKTTLRKMLKETGNCRLTIIDDLYGKNGQLYGGTIQGSVEKLKQESDFILFDYRACEYLPDLDAIYLVVPEREIQRDGGSDYWLRSSPLVVENIKEFYTVKMP